MFTARVEHYTIKEFMGRQQGSTGLKTASRRKASKLLLPLAVAPVVASKRVFAETATVVTAGQLRADNIYDKVLNAFDPLVTLTQALAYPIALVVVVGGALCIMVGQREKGFAMMQGAGLGYVLVQITPFVFKVLVEAMKGA